MCIFEGKKGEGGVGEVKCVKFASMLFKIYTYTSK